MTPPALTTAFLLRSHPYGESDRIVTFITESYGKMSGMAKGAKRSQRRFAGTLEPFVRVRVAFRTRPRSDLVFLERSEFLQAFRGFSGDLDRFALGSYILDLTDRMVLGRETGTEVFRLVDATLSLLDSVGPRSAIVRGFELHLLDAAGYRPALESCRSCNRPAAQIPSPMIVPGRGGVLCRGCHRGPDAGHSVTGETLAALIALQHHDLGRGAPDATLSEGSTAGAEGITEALIGHVITRPLRSRPVMSALLQAGRAG